jgi:SAM-dependent methyltransferase
MHRLPPDHQRDLDQLPAYYWWHRRRIEMVAASVQRFLNPKAGDPFHYLDIGGGTGSTTLAVAEVLRQWLHLNLNANNTISIDGDTSLESFQETKPIRFEHFDIEKEWNVKLEGFQLVTLLDVIEHVQDPVALLKRARSQIDPHGIGVITVPAYAFLFSEWDIALGHKKRYTRQMLRQECHEAGLRVVWDSYLYCYMLPVAVVRRLVFSQQNETAEFPRLPGVVNRLLRGAGVLERGIGRVVSIPFGTSVAAVVRPT